MNTVVPALLALASGLAAGLTLTPAARALARRWGFVAKPAADRWHQQPTAMMGGVAIGLATMVGFGVGLIAAGPTYRAALTASWLPAVSVGLVSVFLLAVGLVDDRKHLRPQTKFTLQVIAGGLLLAAGGVSIAPTPWFWVNTLITLFWFVGVTNAFNLLDNMDGVAAGVAAIAAIFLGVALIQSGAVGSALIALAMAGATIGFLRYNFKPASIFMGDAGSLFLGSLLAGLVAVSPHATSSSLVSVLFVPVAIIAVPILDTTLVTVTRMLSGRKISQGGRDHSTHRLVALGLSERGAALLIYGFAAAGGLVALGLTRLALDAGLMAGSVFLIALALLAAYLGKMHIEHPNEGQASGNVTLLMAKLLYKKSMVKILLDVVLLTLAWYAAFRLRFDGAPPPDYALAFEHSLLLVLPLQMLMLGVFGAWRGAWQYVSVVDLNRVVAALLVSGFLTVLLAHAAFPPLAASHSIIYIDVLVAAALVMGARVSFRSLDLLRHTVRSNGRRVLVYGAGAAGELAVREMRSNVSLGLLPVAFLDDDRNKKGVQIHGLTVVGSFEDLVPVTRRFGAECVLLGISEVTAERLVEIRHAVEAAGLDLMTLSVRMHRVRVAEFEQIRQPEVAAAPQTA